MAADLSDNLSLALDLASQGLFVFPCHPGGEKVKQPLGLYSWRKQSTNDDAQIRQWWGRYPAAAIGLDLGKSGLVVIDCDRKAEADGVAAFGDLMAAHGYSSDGDTIVATPNAGTHFIFRQPPDEELGNGTGELPRGIDVRGSGGYIIAPGTRMQDGRIYEVFGSVKDAREIPGWITEIIRARPERPAASPGPTPSVTVDHSDQRIAAYVERAMAEELGAVASAPDGTRNNQLNTSAFSLGQLVGAGWISRHQVEDALTHAAQGAGLKPHEIGGTIRSGLDAGIREPRTMTDRPEPDLSHINAVADRILARHQAQQSQIAQSELEPFDLVKPALEVPYLIKAVLDAGTMSVLYGPSNSGKTFFALDMAYHVAIGERWRDLRVGGTAVLYLAAEGGNGIANRIVGLRQTTGVVDVPFALRRGGLDLLNPKADVRHVISLAQEVEQLFGQPCGLIVIDTLSRVVAGGDENSPEDMTSFVKNCDYIRQVTGCHVLLIHHSGKNVAQGARGHSSLRAAVDTEIELEVDEDGNRQAVVRKQRDHSGGEQWPFGLLPVDLGVDQDGDPVTTCVVEAEAPPKAAGQELPDRATCIKILDDIRAAWDEGNPYSVSAQNRGGSRYAPRALAHKHNLIGAQIDMLLRGWLDNAIVVVDVANSRTKQRGLRVIGRLD